MIDPGDKKLSIRKQAKLLGINRNRLAARPTKTSEEDLKIMAIMDDGQGFDNTATSSGKKKNRLGLLGMRERVEMIGGVFRVESAPGEPTAIHVELPDGNAGGKKSRANG